MNPVKLTSLLLVVSVLMSFGCATTNPKPMQPMVEQDQETQNSAENATWQWQALYDLLSLGGSFAASH
jgi:hypothetical protein